MFSQSLDDYKPTQAGDEILLIDHFSRLNFNFNPVAPRQTNIICTIGPASQNVEKLVELMKAGMNIARLNFSHGSYEYHAETIANVREAVKLFSKQLGLDSYPIGIALDTKGPEIRTGVVPGGGDIELIKGASVKLTTDDNYKEDCSADNIYVDYKQITNIVSVGNKVYMDDGLISLLAKEVGVDYIICEILNGGKLGSKKGCNLPGTPVDLPAVSEKDTDDLLFGVEQDVDMIFASFIRDGAAVIEIRRILGEKGKHIKILSKIENFQGVDNIDEIIKESDGIMVARGDLGIEIPTEKIFVVQKQVIAKCNLIGKPVICATQMLDSMIEKPRPTRAESSDVANAVLDGADCVMLSGESAKGAYPIVCVETMHAICREAEATVFHTHFFSELLKKIKVPSNVSETTALSAVCASFKCFASAIITLTRSGKTAQQLSHFRPFCPIIAVCRNARAARQCQLYRGIYPLFFENERLPEWPQDIDTRIQYAITFGKAQGFINNKQPVVLITGWRPGPGSSNTIRIVNIE